MDPPHYLLLRGIPPAQDRAGERWLRPGGRQSEHRQRRLVLYGVSHDRFGLLVFPGTTGRRHSKPSGTGFLDGQGLLNPAPIYKPGALNNVNPVLQTTRSWC